MAINSKIYKVELQIADMDRHYYQTHPLTIALHPSETEERMMYRLLAFVLNAHEFLTFGKGISSDDEPDLWQKNLHDGIDLWIELGQPDEKRIRKACGKAAQVIIYNFQSSVADIWFKQNKKHIKRFKNLQIVSFQSESSLGDLAQRNMQLSVSIQDGEIWLSNGEYNVQILPIWRDLA